MPLVYTASNDENYPPITTMMRKTKRDESRTMGGSVNKRPALATISNIQSANSNSDLGKQIRQRQANPFSIRSDPKKPSPKQKQIAARSQQITSRTARTTCANARASTTAALRQSTLSSFNTAASSSTAAFSVFKDRNSTPSTSTASSSRASSSASSSGVSSASSSGVSCSAPSILRPTCPTTKSTVHSPMVVDTSTRSRHLSCASSRNMDIDESSNMSDMSVDLRDVEVEQQQQPRIRNIDEDACLEESPEYAEDIDNYLRKMEQKYKPRVGYMARQRHITDPNRSTVIDWMFEVCDEFHLSQKTFQLAVSYVDRFLSKMSMPRRNLQLLGTTALFIACKIEEVDMFAGSALAARFVWITDNTYTVSQLFKMEYMILDKLSFEINSPTPLCFQDRFLKASGGDCREQYFTEYLCNRALVQGKDFLKYTPSHLTAAAVALSRAIQKPGETVWTPTLAHYTKYSYADIRECMEDLLELFKLDSSLNKNENARNPELRRYAAVWNKYNLARYMFVLHKEPLEVIPLQ